MGRKIAIVTGVSRLRGVGKAICIELAKRGTDIFFTYWKEYDKKMPWGVDDDEPELIQKEIKSLGVRCEKLELDLSSDSASILLFKEAERKLGVPDILVNNATYSTNTNIYDFSSEELDKHYQVNLRAVILLISEFVRRFDKGKGGRIINLSSGQSLGAMSDEIAYAVTKGAIETLTRTVYQELAQKGITINAINPGLTDSGWMSEEVKDKWLKHFPMQRIGMPEDAARLVAFLSGEEAEWVTGQIIHSEGGFLR